MNDKTRVSIFISPEEVSLLKKYSQIMDMPMGGVARLAMGLGLKAYEQAFDPNMTKLMISALNTIDQVVKDEQAEKELSSHGRHDNSKNR
jgi:hypothetical protein